MRNGTIIIDADGHALDQESMYRQRLPEQFRRRQSIGGGGDGFDRRQNGRIPYPPVTVERYLQDADLEGIDVMVLYPTGGLGYTRLREHDYSIAFAQTYNDWIAEWCSANPKRLKAVCITPLHVDVPAAIKELERAKKLGLVGVMVNTFMRGHNVAHRDCWPFYEAGADWVPFWMEHMDGEWSKRKFDAPLLKMLPSEYMRCGRVFVSCEPEEKTLPYVAEWLGADHILFPSDYPHWDGAFPEAVNELMVREDVSDQLKRKIFCDNPQRLYGFTVDPADFKAQEASAASHSAGRTSPAGSQY